MVIFLNVLALTIAIKAKSWLKKKRLLVRSYQGQNLVSQNDSPGIPMKFASSLQHLLWNNNPSLSIDVSFEWNAAFVPFTILVFLVAQGSFIFLPLFSLSQSKTSKTGLYSPLSSFSGSDGLPLSAECWWGKVRWRKACCLGWRSWSVGREYCLLMYIVPPWYLYSFAMNSNFSERKGFFFLNLNTVWCVSVVMSDS